MSGRVLVVGSINLDLVVAAPRLPGPGETVLGGELQRHPGGKGANQAVAAARAGASVAMIGAVGDDAEGQLGLAALREEGVDVRGVAVTAGASGVAIIAVAPDGENQIVVAPGANARLGALDAEGALAALEARPGDVLLASLEVPMHAIAAAVATARRLGARVVINPAPASDLDWDLLAGSILTPNRTEAAQLAGTGDPAAAARRLLALGADGVAVTLGSEGCAAFDADGRMDLPAVDVTVVDATGAGDAFSGVLAARMASGAPFREAARAANVAAGLSVRRQGARDGLPTRPEIDAELAG